MEYDVRSAETLRWGLERRGQVGALVVLAVVLLYLLVPKAVNAHVHGAETTVEAGDHFMLDAIGDGSAKLDLSALAGWTLPPSASDDSVLVTRGDAKVSMRLVGNVRNPALAFDRLPRVLRLSDPKATWSRTGEFRGHRGLTGYRGEFTTSTRTGSLFLAGRDETALFVLVSAPSSELEDARDAAETVLDTAEINP